MDVALSRVVTAQTGLPRSLLRRTPGRPLIIMLRLAVVLSHFLFADGLVVGKSLAPRMRLLRGGDSKMLDFLCA